MQEQVTFYIDFVNGDDDTLIRTIKEIVSEYSFETPASREETGNRISKWLDDIYCSSNQVRNDSECTMYVFDYEVLFPDLFTDISTKLPQMSFTGHAEYYNDNYGTMDECDVEYADGHFEIKQSEPEEGQNTDEIVAIIRKILAPLSEEQVAQLCNDMDIDESSEDIALEVFENAKFWGESYDELMEYIYNSLIEEVRDVAGDIGYDQNWDVIK